MVSLFQMQTEKNFVCIKSTLLQINNEQFLIVSSPEVYELNVAKWQN